MHTSQFLHTHRTRGERSSQCQELAQRCGAVVQTAAATEDVVGMSELPSVYCMLEKMGGKIHKINSPVRCVCVCVFVLLVNSHT